MTKNSAIANPRLRSEAFIPVQIEKAQNKVVSEGLSLLTGIVLLSLLAQVSIPLPWTPVPITGQTFGVTLVALSWGRKRALSVVLGYLALGGMGFPIFAAAKSGLSLGPTMGYLFGMVVSSFVVGGLADRGFTKTFTKSLLASFCGSACVFACGLFGLSFFVPTEALLTAGLLPFIPGDIIKNTVAAALSNKIRKQI